MAGMLQLLVTIFFIVSIAKKISARLTPEKKAEIKKQFNIPAERPQPQPSRTQAKTPRPKQKASLPPRPNKAVSDSFVSLEEMPSVQEISDAPSNALQANEKPKANHWALGKSELVRSVVMSEILGKPKALRR